MAKNERRSDGITEVPHNKTLIIEQLTAKEPSKPEIVYGLQSIEDVFNNYKPSIGVFLKDYKGAITNEKFSFNSLTDFQLEKILSKSKSTQSLVEYKNFLFTLANKVNENKNFREVIDNQENKDQLLELIQQLKLDVSK